MKKIPTIFKRNPENLKEILNEHNPDCEWVFAGEGVATRKYDGTCCLVNDGKIFKRRELKKGAPIPSDFQAVDFDQITGKTVGWVPVSDSKEDRWHLEAFNNAGNPPPDGTYELLGPKIQGNPENFSSHILLAHSIAESYSNVPRTFDGIKEFMEDLDIEGLVFHHPDGRMAKIKKRDFGQNRK